MHVFVCMYMWSVSWSYVRRHSLSHALRSCLKRKTDLLRSWSSFCRVCLRNKLEVSSINLTQCLWTTASLHLMAATSLRGYETHTVLLTWHGPRLFGSCSVVLAVHWVQTRLLCSPAVTHFFRDLLLLPVFQHSVWRKLTFHNPLPLKHDQARSVDHPPVGDSTTVTK